MVIKTRFFSFLNFLILFLTLYSLPVLSYFNGSSINGIDRFISSKKLDLIAKDSSKQIYQIRSKSYLYGYSCGFFVLHNSRNLESFVGLNNTCDISQICSQYINSKKINPSASLSTIDLLYMVDNVVNLKNFHILNLAQPNQIKLQLHNVSWQTEFSTKHKTITLDVTLQKHDASVKVKAPYRTSESNVKALVMDAVIEKLKEKLVSLKNVLRTNSSSIINFACVLSSENHYILASVVKLPNENPALFIFDNMNFKYNSNPERTSIINGIYNMFCV